MPLNRITLFIRVKDEGARRVQSNELPSIEILLPAAMAVGV
jgi:hypothetical protein